MAMTVQRDPFARGEYKRFSEGNRYQHRRCRWCGNTPKVVYSYVWWEDGKPEPKGDNGQFFCNFGCFDSYHK